MSGVALDLPIALALRPRPKDAPPVLHDPTLVATTFAWEFQPRVASLVLVVKATYALVQGEPARAPEEAEPLAGDEPHTEGGSLRVANDFAPTKPRADVTLRGHAYPARGRTDIGHVSLVLGELRHAAAVVGDRFWQGGVPTAPESFERVPLTWEHAFGGPGFGANPFGRGFGQAALPNLEAPERLLRAPGETPAPVGFAPIERERAARAGKLGRYDGAWLAERWPYLPADADLGYFNAAPAELQCAHLRGDEAYELAGVHPEHAVLAGSLPGVRARAFTLASVPGGSRIAELPLALDTVDFDADALRVSLVWRGGLPVSSPLAPEIARLFVVTEGVDAATPLDAIFARLAEKLVEVEGADVLVANDDAQASRRMPPPMPGIPTPRVAADEARALVADAGSLVGADLSGFDLEGVDLRGRDLRGVNLVHARLHGANLDGADLRGAVLFQARALGASLRGANLEGANLAEAVFTECDFAGANLDHASFADGDVQQSRFDEARLARTSFVEARLGGASFARVVAPGLLLSGAWLEGVAFAGASLDDAQLYDASATGARFDGASLRRVRCDGALLARASFAGAQLAGASFEATELTEARFDGARLDESVFPHAVLPRATLDGASARSVRFRNADLTGATALGADLAESSFESARLGFADLRDANLYGAELWQADLAGAKLDGARLAATKLAPR